MADHGGVAVTLVGRCEACIKEEGKRMGYELVGTPKTEKVTQQLAVRFRDMEPVPHDRPLNPKRVEAYRKMLTAGLFRPVQWATVHCNETQATYRVNGKHTSNLFAEYEELPQVIHATIEHYHCDDLDDVARLYATFDSRTQVRTTNDINRAFAAIDDELSQVPTKIINLCVTAIAFVKHGNEYAKVAAAERAECLLEESGKRFVLWVYDVLGGHCGEKTRLLWRGPVVAAMHACYQKSRRDASEFWLAVRDGTGATPKTPDRVLHRFLLSKTVNYGGGATSKNASAIAAPREMYVKCLHAWNAWRRGATTDLKYHAQAKIPAAS
ncbi:MAG: hypothetical protein ACK6CT_15415 [Planctomycetia bacterium]